ncbi:hypothetical protein, unlikely [Trypanosoma brucei brucei TREU927]|uniref:T. brucei spp.-specific protein n=1 Tax=Trypanosoma brucei brucei (strain 927/4 GUTat10.1) TaxID=185431 RepID=Q38EK1_TRYB2|nr:hypothetical protein, unlikely [Trypanosoma brucei brucei TREU927]EAN76769.1 hypothetical protein, unlikely [Trypanosoma brucei brucei TREU927]
MHNPSHPLLFMCVNITKCGKSVNFTFTFTFFFSNIKNVIFFCLFMFSSLFLFLQLHDVSLCTDLLFYILFYVMLFFLFFFSCFHVFTYYFRVKTFQKLCGTIPFFF